MSSLPDNYDLWRRHEEVREHELERCPRCSYCDEPISDAFAFHIDGEWYHKDCFENEYYVEVTDL